MSTTMRRLRSGVFSGAILSILTFGASQAFAAPAAEADARACSPSACRSYCVSTCPEWASSCFGYCEDDGHCQCEYS